MTGGSSGTDGLGRAHPDAEVPVPGRAVLLPKTSAVPPEEPDTVGTAKGVEEVGQGSGGPGGKFQEVTNGLEKASKRQRRWAIGFGIGSALCALIGICFLAWQAVEGFDSIKEATNEHASDTAITAQTAFLIIRGTGLAGIVAGVVYYVLSLARSALDQATRYEKRLIASKLIDYALHEPYVDAKKLEAAHQIVEVWGSTVESAYTPPRVAKRVGGLKFGATRDGGSIEADPRQP